MPAPDLRNPCKVGAVQQIKYLLPTDYTFSYLQSFAVDAAGIRQVHVAHEGQAQANVFGEITIVRRAEQLSVRKIQCHADIQLPTELRHLLRADERVLEPLATQVPRPGRQILG